MEIAIPVPDVVDRLQSRLRSQFASAVQEWSESVSALARWEDDHLLDHPTPASLADHKAAVERLLGFGRFLTQTTGHPEFTDRRTTDIVASTQALLGDKLRIWHGPGMSRSESDRILAEVFPDES
jgi:hypothetical protein